MTYWCPVLCTLQLSFVPAGGSGTITAGCRYTGTSVIHYRKCSLATAATTAEEQATGTSTATGEDDVTAQSDYATFLRQLKHYGRQDALHLHAYTEPSSSYPKVIPMEVRSYKVTVAGCGAASSSSSSPGLFASGTMLKVVSVMAAEDEVGGSQVTAHRSDEADKRGKRKNKAKSAASTSSGGVSAPAVPHDIGSKLVSFEHAADLPVGSEVLLTMQFSAAVQEWDQGGVYAPATATAAGGVILTHFEVSLARFAFPCPDRPQYRPQWQLKVLQLPASFHTVVTNGTQLQQRALPGQRAVQFHFAVCGPLPAYVFAFAAFAGEAALQTVESTFPLWSGAGSRVEYPLRVIATQESGITFETLDQVLRISLEALQLLQSTFLCPLPLLQSTEMVVLLAPTMPYISGMEHHCCIFLNETIYSSAASQCRVGGGGGKRGDGGGLSVEQVELIVHELAHHWVGNALGLPFSVKEGVCQVLEQCISDLLLGKPMRRMRLVGEDGVTETIRGKEFTWDSYQQALLRVQRLVAMSGFSAFENKMQKMVKDHIAGPMADIEERGGLEAIRLSGEDAPTPPYLSSEVFLSYIQAPS